MRFRAFDSFASQDLADGGGTRQCALRVRSSTISDPPGRIGVTILSLSGTLSRPRRLLAGAGNFAPHHQLNSEEQAMNWDRIEGNWKQLTGKVKEKWGKLTDDDIAQINGNREQLEGKLQARYGYAKDQVRKDVDDWLGRM
jgi:uncharacterized protein YjbJ (UPF0337 family)